MTNLIVCIFLRIVFTVKLAAMVDSYCAVNPRPMYRFLKVVLPTLGFPYKTILYECSFGVDIKITMNLINTSSLSRVKFHGC